MLALMLILAQASPEAGDAFDAERTLDAIARSGDLMIVAARDEDEAKSSTQVLEANINGCIVTLKTEIEATGFTASFVELGEGSLIEPIRNDEIRLQSAPELEGELILRSNRSVEDVLQALASTRLPCQVEKEIF